MIGDNYLEYFIYIKYNIFNKIENLKIDFLLLLLFIPLSLLLFSLFNSLLCSCYFSNITHNFYITVLDDEKIPVIIIKKNIIPKQVTNKCF